jgi:16S rRNA (guanine966-N2)-methyltransferase
MSLRLSGGRRLKSPPGSVARPTSSRVRLAVMNLLAAELPGCSWLDLCSGSGATACEALHRGASRVVAIEQDRSIAAIVRANLEAVSQGLGDAGRKAKEWSVHCREVGVWLADVNQTRSFDLIYADPPYAADLYDQIANGVLAGGWLKPGGTLILECSSSQIPAVPPGWCKLDQRRYGSTSLLLLGQAA